MNERIRELAEQAGCSIDGMGYGEGNVEKFAKLIVRECSSYVEGTGNWLVAMEMKQYFGVEE